MRANNVSSNISNKTKNIQNISNFVSMNRPKIANKNFNSIKINSKNVNSNILNDKNLLIKERENKIQINTFNNKEEKNYYCIKCDKIISFPKNEKAQHVHDCIFPLEEYLTKNDVLNIIKLYKSFIQDLNNEIQNLKNNNNFPIANNSSLKRLIKENKDYFLISSLEKEENEQEYIDEIFIEGIIANNKIQENDEFTILKNEKEPLHIEYLDYLSIIVDPNINIIKNIEQCKINYINSIEIRGDSAIISEIKEVKNQMNKNDNAIKKLESVLPNEKNHSSDIEIENIDCIEICCISSDLEMDYIDSFELCYNERKWISIIDKGGNLFIKNKSNMNDNSLEKENKYLKDINELSKELRLKDKEIKILKNTFPFEIKQGDRIMTIIFTTTDQKFFHSIICKNTDIFANLVSQLFKEYPDYKDKSVYFMCNGIIIKEYKSLDENKIKNRDIILLNLLSNSSS